MIRLRHGPSRFWAVMSGNRIVARGCHEAPDRAVEQAAHLAALKPGTKFVVLQATMKFVAPEAPAVATEADVTPLWIAV